MKPFIIGAQIRAGFEAGSIIADAIMKCKEGFHIFLHETLRFVKNIKNRHIPLSKMKKSQIWPKTFLTGVSWLAMMASMKYNVSHENSPPYEAVLFRD